MGVKKMVNENADLEGILLQLSSEEARVSFVCKIMNKMDIPPEMIRRAISFYEFDRQEPARAAKIAKDAGMKENSRSLYEIALKKLEEEESFLYGVSIAEEAGMDEKAKVLVEREIQKRISDGNYIRAADLAKETNQIIRAIEIYETAANRTPNSKNDAWGIREAITNAFRLARNAGLKEKTDKLYKRLIEDPTSKEVELRDLGELAEEAEMFEDAISFYEKCGPSKIFRAAIIAKKLNLDNKARELFGRVIKEEEMRLEDQISRHGEHYHYEEAARSARELGDTKKADYFYDAMIKSNLLRESYESALKTSIEAGERKRIMRIAKVGIEYYKQTHDLERAARVAKMAGLEETSRELYLQIFKTYEERGDYGEARKLAKEIGQIEMAEFYSKLESMLERKE